MSAFLRAPELLGMGYSPILTDPSDGLPHVKGWDKYRVAPMHVETMGWWASLRPDAGLAVVGSYNGLVPIDVDSSDPEIIQVCKSILPWPVVARFGTKGYGTFYRDPTGKLGGRNFMLPSPISKPLVEVKTNGVLTIPPTLHRKTGRPYRWMQCQQGKPARTLFDTPVGELPVITAEHLAALEKALARWCPPRPAFEAKAASGAAPLSDRRMHALAVSALGRACEFLQGLAQDRNIQLRVKARAVGKFVHHAVLDREVVERALLAACKANGSLEKHGLKQCGWTIASGLKAATGDALPQLVDRPYHRPPPVYV